MAAGSSSEERGSVFRLGVRQIVVAGIAGGIFGIFSFVQAEVPFFRDPLVSILPRLFIGVVAWIVFVSLRRWSVDLAAAAAGVLGSFANTVGVVGMAVLLGYLPLSL